MDSWRSTPSKYFASYGWDKEFELWDLPEMRNTALVALPDRCVVAAAFSADEKLLVSLSQA